MQWRVLDFSNKEQKFVAHGALQSSNQNLCSANVCMRAFFGLGYWASSKFHLCKPTMRAARCGNRRRSGVRSDGVADGDDISAIVHNFTTVGFISMKFQMMLTKGLSMKDT